MRLAREKNHSYAKIHQPTACRYGACHKKCMLGEYCQCAFYAELFSGFIDEELNPEEERA
jgi:Zn-finger protein